MKYQIMLFSFFLCTLMGCAPNKKFSQSVEHKVIKNLLDHEISIDALDSILNRNMNQLNVPGVSFAIINDGKLIHSAVKGYADKEKKKKVSGKTIFEGASLSKPLFAYLVMMFVEEGKLNLDKPLHEYLRFEEISYDDRYKKITARMVLSHTSGFPNWRTDNKEGKMEIKFEPGSSFEYSGEGYQYLARVLMHILNTKDEGLEAIYQKRIAKPLEMEVTRFIQDAHNINHKAKPYQNGELIKGESLSKEFGAAFSIHSEAVDFSKWLIAVMEEKILSIDSYQKLFKEQIQLPENSMHRSQGITEWTLGFAKAPLPFGTVFAHGGNNLGYTSLFVINREKKWGSVMFTNANQSMLPLQVFMELNSM